MTQHRLARFVFAFGCASLLALTLTVPDVDARGRGGVGRGGGGMRADGGVGSGRGVSRGGPARSGSVWGDRRGQAPRSGADRRYDVDRARSGSGGTHHRERTFEGPRGDTIERESEITRTEDGLHRESSWESSSGASGSSSGDITFENGRVQERSRSGSIETAGGETATREVTSTREGDSVVRRGAIETSTGIDAEAAGRISRTDDGFVARGGVRGEDHAGAGTIVRRGGDTYVRGAATDGDRVAWGRAHCRDGRCYGSRVTVDIDHYYYYPYYYYPYYYGYYSCRPGSYTVWYSGYGTPIYGCANTVVIHTTIALDSSSSGRVREAQVVSAPVLMYELSDEVVVYATTYEPAGVYSEKRGARWYWVPGPAEGTPEVEEWIEQGAAMLAPSANATVITYTIGDTLVYLTNEGPVGGIVSQPTDALFAWIPGVRDPGEVELAAIATAVTAHRAGGSRALDREARKLEEGREPPPDANAAATETKPPT